MIGAFDVSGLSAVIYKEIRHLIREPLTLVLVLVLPVTQLLIYGYAINMHVEHVTTVYYDADRSRLSTELATYLKKSQEFQVVGSASSMQQVRRALVSGRAQVAFAIPAGFAADVERGKPVTVQMFVDGSDAVVAQAAYGAAARMGSALTAWADPMDASGALTIRTQAVFNPSLRTPNFLIPALIGLVIQNVTMILTSISVVRERERGTLDQMRALSIGPGAIILGKMIPYGIVGFLDVLLVLAAMSGVFAVPVAGSVPLLLALCLAFLVTGLGLGLLVSTVARSQLQASVIVGFFLLPSFMLTGMFFEVQLMPVPAQVIAYALPMTYFLQVLRGIIIRGAGLADLWLPALVTCAFAVATMVLASIRFSARSS
jgi:ABC-type multidrug transport system permease subunit